MRTTLLLGGLLAMLLSACQTGSGAATSPDHELPATGTHWRLASGLSVKVPADVRVTLSMGDALAISGSSGCNRYNGSFVVDGNETTVSPLAATKRACVGPGRDVESAFFTAMSSVKQVSVDGDKLVMQLAAGGELVFHADSAAE